MTLIFAVLNIFNAFKSWHAVIYMRHQMNKPKVNMLQAVFADAQTDLLLDDWNLGCRLKLERFYRYSYTYSFGTTIQSFVVFKCMNDDVNHSFN